MPIKCDFLDCKYYEYYTTAAFVYDMNLSNSWMATDSEELHRQVACESWPDRTWKPKGQLYHFYRTTDEKRMPPTRALMNIS